MPYRRWVCCGDGSFLNKTENLRLLLPETKDFHRVWAAVPLALVSEQDPSQEVVSAREPAEILI